MPITDIKWEIGFGATMFTAAPTWTEPVNADGERLVRSANTWRGRQSVDGRFTTGYGSLVLSNRDGRFNPENSAGAYFPDVKIGVPIRATTVVNSTTYPIFYGQARAWPPTVVKGNVDSVVTVPLVDGFYTLNLEDLAGNSYPAQRTDERITAVLDDIGWPAALRDIDTGIATVQATEFAQPGDGGEQPALAHLQDVAESEVGVLFMSRDGKVTFRNRVASSSPTVAASFTNSEMQALTLAYNDDFLYNVIRIAREDGGQVEIDSSAGAPRRVLTRDVMPMGNDSEALNVAEWLSGIFGDQRLRIDGARFKLHQEATWIEDVIGRELRDVINITHVPIAGDTINQDASVESIRHEMVKGDWTAHLTVTPLSTLESQDYWILGTSALDTDTRVA